MAKKNIIRLTESNLKKIITESVKRILKEGYAEDYFIVKDVTIKGKDVTSMFNSKYGNQFRSKYDFEKALNQFASKFGVKILDLDLASEFGESGDEVYIYSEPNDVVEAHGSYGGYDSFNYDDDDDIILQ